MSRFSRESLIAVLGRDSIELRSLDRRTAVWDVRAQQPAHLSEPGMTDAGLEEALAGLLSQHARAGASLSTVVGDDHARYFIVEPPANARSVSDLRLAAGLRMEALFGDAVADWTLDADWSATRRFLACAVPSVVLSAVAGAIVTCKLRDAGVTTEFVASWRRHRRQMPKRQGWVAHVGRQAVVLAACVDGHPSAISTMSTARPLSPDDLKMEIERCVLRWNLPAPTTVYLLGQVLAGADQRIDWTNLVSVSREASAATTKILLGKAA